MRAIVRKFVVLLVGVVALAAPLTVAESAAASEYWEKTNFRGSPGDSDHAYYCARSQSSKAYACFMPYDERFYVLDWDKDGLPPVMEWKSSSGRYGRVYHEYGHPNWAWRNKSFGESTKITFRACVIQFSAMYYCGDWRTVEA
jgi:hypothetical protein